jgi:hypothetical protein
VKPMGENIPKIKGIGLEDTHHMLLYMDKLSLGHTLDAKYFKFFMQWVGLVFWISNFLF